MNALHVNTLRKGISLLLRLFIAYLFLSHGFKALFVEESWIPMFEAVRLSQDLAHILMPVVGIVDIAVGLSVLIKPQRPILLWAALWPSAPALASYLTGTSDIAHEILHVFGPLIACLALFLLHFKVWNKALFALLGILIVALVSIVGVENLIGIVTHSSHDHGHHEEGGHHGHSEMKHDEHTDMKEHHVEMEEHDEHDESEQINQELNDHDTSDTHDDHGH